MSHYVAIIEDAGPDKAIGVWFPDLPGCFSAGDTLDEAIQNAPEAIALYAEALEADGRPIPRPRPLSVLKNDPSFVSESRDHMVALISAPDHSLCRRRVRPRLDMVPSKCTQREWLFRGHSSSIVAMKSLGSAQNSRSRR